MECTTEGGGLHELGAAEVQSLYAVLCRVPDYRRKRGRRYGAAQALVVLILAKLAGEQTISGAAHWARLRSEWLRQVLGLSRLPCANTYHYIMAHLDVAVLNRLLSEWLAQVAPELEPGQLLHWAIDGKVLRGSHRQSPTPQPGQEVLGVYAVERGYLQHCEPIDGKGYEAATAQRFVARTDCTGTVITADALHTRPRLCRQIRRQNGHYVLVVKRNRAELEAEIRHLFALPPYPAYPVATCRTVDVGHGRTTIRQLHTSSELNLALANQWRDVAQVFLLERWGVRNGKTTYESVCGLTSLSADQASPATLLALVQAHWQIENRNHWRRDATLREDACIVRHALVAVILALLNATILALFDIRKVSNARAMIRTFAAFPDQALDLLIKPL